MSLIDVVASMLGARHKQERMSETISASRKKELDALMVKALEEPVLEQVQALVRAAFFKNRSPVKDVQRDCSIVLRAMSITDDPMTVNEIQYVARLGNRATRRALETMRADGRVAAVQVKRANNLGAVRRVGWSVCDDQ
jgi:hypothetical protein